MTSANVRFMYDNQIERGTISASSSIGGFGPENVRSQYRWKEWMTAGAFEIHAGNKILYINDGDDKTVTLTEGQYLAAALAAHIQTQLNASSTNWTVSYSAITGKFTIGRSSGTALLRLSVTTNAIWDTLGYVGAINQDVGTGTAADQRRNHTSEWIEFDLVGTLPGFRALLMTGNADRLFGWALWAQDAEIRVRAANVTGNEAVWASAPLNVVLNIEETGVFRFWETAQQYRYVRIDFKDRTNPEGPQFAVNQLFLGDFFEPAEFNINVGFAKNLIDPSTTMESDSKSRFHRRYRKFWAFSELLIANIQDEDREQLDAIVSELGRTTPFWISLDPNAEISASVGELTKYVEFSDEFVDQHVLYKRFTKSLSVIEVV